ncbi:Fruiting body protein SC7 [Mycena indigotica]|uniref:Fruiting body protein SC7 n=1 Tax=Mycena indigotica TaxID=2126181 RepID=A0A8H6SRH5_9AGAR|nr:Fruiting body protein SC7 [Mycena indigotica]KAF7303386.1 Fruiting body protein SC7 [Mycena indigotica]
MAGPRPAASRSSPCSSRPRCSCSPPCSPTATTRAPTTAASAPATAAPPAPSPRAAPPPTPGGAVNATPKPSTTAAPPPEHPAPPPPPPAPSSTPGRSPAPPPPPPPPAPTSTSSTPPPASAPTGPALPAGAINAGRGRRAARLRSGPGAVPQVPQRHPRQPQGRPPLVERHALRRGPEGRGHVRVRALGREGRPVRARTSRAGTGKYGIEKAIVSSDERSADGDGAGDYDPKNPVPSHFTQVVWRGTTQVGCALTVCAPGTIFDPKFTNTAEYYVCEYAPPGNIIGQFDQMVSV